MKEVYSPSDVKESLRRITTRLNDVQRRDGNKFVVSVSGRPAIHTKIQSLFNLKFNSEIDRSLYELMMTHATAAEKLGPGGFNRSLELLLEKLDDNECGNQHAKNERPRVATSNDVTLIVEKYASRGGVRTSSMVRRAIELAGFGGRIIIEKTSSSMPSVELVRGYTFELQQLLPVDVSFIRPRIVCIDGYIEDVSEVHHLLTAAGSAKEPCMLFIRGASDDVKHTLKVNYDRGSLRVVPIGVRFDLEGMNTLIDISIVTGSDLVSSLKGDLISNIKFDQLPCADQVTAFRDRVVITNTSTHKRVGEHVAQIRTRREEEENDDKSRLFDMRVKSLSPNHVVIRLPDDKDFVTNSQSIDCALRAVKSIVDYGVTEDGSPITTELAAQVHVDRCMKTLANVGALLF